MAYSMIQSRGTFGSGASLALSFVSTPAVGSLITVCASMYGVINADLATNSVTDNQGNSYTCQNLLVDFNDGCGVAVYSAIASTSSGTFTVTVTPTGSGDLAMGIMSLTGNHATPADQNGSGTGTSTAPSSGDETPTEDNELLVAAMSHSGSDRTLTEEAGWSLVYENEGGTANIPISVVYKIQAGAAAEDADWTIGTGSVSWGAVIATYKAAAGGSQSPALKANYSRFPKFVMRR